MPKFSKGQSGNPNGRPKKADENRIRDLAVNAIKGKFGSEVKFFEHIAGLAVNAKSDRDKIAAATKVMEYAYGKPSQSIDMTSGGESMFPGIKPLQWGKEEKPLLNSKDN